MQKKISLLIFLLSFIMIVALTTNTVYGKDNDSIEQITIEDVGVSFNKESILFIFSVIAGIASIIEIFKFCAERKCEIKKLEVQIIHTTEKEDEVFECDEIFREGKIIKQSSTGSAYYLKMIIEVEIPSKKNHYYFYIKNLTMYFSDYQLRYKPISKSIFNIKKLEIDKQQKRCICVLTYPLLKKAEDKKNLNPILNLQNPRNMQIRFQYSFGSLVSRVYGLIFSKPHRISFEKKDIENNVSPVAVISNSIL